MSIKDLLNVSEADIEAEIASIHAAVAPLRAKRDEINVEIESRKQKARALSKQINDLERPLRRLEVLLKEAKKIAGKTVVNMTVT